MIVRKMIYVDDGGELEALMREKQLSIRTMSLLVSSDGNYMYRYLHGAPMEDANYHRIKKIIEEYKVPAVPCAWCGIPFEKVNTRRIYCSKKCLVEATNKKQKDKKDGK